MGGTLGVCIYVFHVQSLTPERDDLLCGVHDRGLRGDGPPLDRVTRGHVDDDQLSPLADAYVLVALQRAGPELDRLRRHSGRLDKLFFSHG